MTIKIGVAGYGNLGRGVEQAVAQNEDMSLAGVFTRREAASMTTSVPGTDVFAWSQLPEHKDGIDVLILCGGSKDDLPQQGPEMAALFNTVDSFDTHATIPEYFAAVDAPARAAGTTAIISTGWDPGLFSINRLFGEAILPEGETYSFWGTGVSQGHSEALRHVPGVSAGVQYTIPADDAVAAARSGTRPHLETRKKHTRECYVVLAEGADADEVRRQIVSMPHYFEPYETTVHFISAEELESEHSAMPHGGFVMRSGRTGTAAHDAESHEQLIEYSLTLGNNPGFTSSVLVAYARAAYRLAQAGDHGAKTPFDVAPGLLSARTPEDLRADLL